MKRLFLCLCFLAFAFPASAATLTLTPSADTYVTASDGSATNGSATEIAVGWSSAYQRTRSFVQFDFASLPKNATITSAQLALPVSSYGTSGTFTHNLYRPTTTWSEATLTWNTQPAAGDLIVSGYASTQTTPTTFDLTDAAKNWYSGTWSNTGVLIMAPEGLGGTFSTRYSTRESANPPTLTITYTAPEVVVAPSIISFSDISVSSGKTAVTVSFRTSDATVASLALTAPTTNTQTETDSASYLHAMTLQNLTPNTTYSYTLSVAGKTGSYTGTFTTSGTPNTAPPLPTGITVGMLVKTKALSAVYLVGVDGKRHAFTHEKVYRSWYSDFSGVTTISAETMASLAIGKNVTYKPGVRLVKFPSVALVYAVDTRSTLRPIASEAVAAAIAGSAWNTMVDDIGIGYYGDYQYSTTINQASEYTPPANTKAEELF